MSSKQKTISEGLNSLFSTAVEVKETPAPEVVVRRRGRPRTNFKEVENQSERGTKPGETRAAFILEKELIRKIKVIAYMDRVNIKDVVTAALEEFVTSWEKENGAIQILLSKKQTTRYKNTKIKYYDTH